MTVRTIDPAALTAAKEAAAAATRDRLRGYYPHATVVLGRALEQAEGSIEALRDELAAALDTNVSDADFRADIKAWLMAGALR